MGQAAPLKGKLKHRFESGPFSRLRRGEKAGKQMGAGQSLDVIGGLDLQMGRQVLEIKR